MASCISELNTDIGNGDESTYPVISTTDTIPVAFGLSVKKKFKLIVSTPDTISFLMTLDVGAPYVMAFFKLSGTTLTSVGNLSSSEQITTFQKDLSEGTYYVCISSIYSSFSGFLKASYSGFVIETRFTGSIYSGEELISNLTIKRATRACNEPFFFTFISGDLPPGTVLQPDGSITGMLPDLDCIDSENSTSPSINWFYQDLGDNRWKPTPRRWRFRARVTLSNFPDVFAEEDFSVDVLNDWNKDKNIFMANSDLGFDRTTTLTQTQTPVTEVLPTIVTNKKESDVIPILDCGCETKVAVGVVSSPDYTEFVNWFNSKYITSLSSKEIVDFVEKFKNTDKFKALFGVRDVTTNEAFDFVSINRNTTDIDYIFLTLGNELNQKNPIEANGYSGETFMVEFT